MHVEVHPLFVVEASAAQFFSIEIEAQRLDQVQVGAGVGAQPNDVAGVRRNLRFEKNDMQPAGGRWIDGKLLLPIRFFKHLTIGASAVEVCAYERRKSNAKKPP